MQDDDNTPYLDGIKIGGRRQETAQRTIEAMHTLLCVGCSAMQQPEAKIAFMAGAAMIPLGALALAMANKDDRSGFAPTMDEIMFGAYYVVSALDRHPDGVVAAFSIEAIDKALRMFKEATGREYEQLCDPLKDAVGLWRNSATNVPEAVRKFLPQ